jgi:LPXTG-motif cell wall-anchored protein
MKGYKLAAAAGAVTAMLGLSMGTAVADDYPGGTPPTVLGEQITREAPAAVLGQSSTQGSVSGASASRGALPLPVTGGDIAGMTAAGVAAVGLGSVLVRRRRRSSSVTA